MTEHRSAHAAARSAAKPHAPAAARLPPRRRWHSALLAALVALLVARPLLPSEAVAWLGDGLPFDMLWLVLALLTAVAAVGRGGFAARWPPRPTWRLRSCVPATRPVRIWATAHASPRPAINMLWEWIALALGLLYHSRVGRQARRAAGDCGGDDRVGRRAGLLWIFPVLRQYAGRSGRIPARRRRDVAPQQPMVRAGFERTTPIREPAGQHGTAGHVCPDQFAGRFFGALAAHSSRQRRRVCRHARSGAQPAAAPGRHASGGRLPAFDPKPQRVCGSRGRTVAAALSDSRSAAAAYLAAPSPPGPRCSACSWRRRSRSAAWAPRC